MMHMLAAHLLMLVALMSTVMAEEYDKCGRPDAVWASWDQVIFQRAHCHAPAPSHSCAQ